VWTFLGHMVTSLTNSDIYLHYPIRLQLEQQERVKHVNLRFHFVIEAWAAQSLLEIYRLIQLRKVDNRFKADNIFIKAATPTDVTTMSTRICAIAS
jgi:hypothetical protein